jgi:hypothetical protein
LPAAAATGETTARKLLEGKKGGGASKTSGAKKGLNIAGSVLKSVSNGLSGSSSAKGQKASKVTGAVGNALKNAADRL